MSILSGIRVLDCSIAMAGPFCGQRLGDMGADVIKIEPTTGEWQRHVSAGGLKGNKINVSFLSLNRNKRSLAVDLKSEAGRAAVHDMVKQSDVFLQNYRPGVAKRLGLDYETLAALNPRLIYLSLSGYGETGPYVDRPGQDLILQGMSGAMLSAGRAGEPPLAAGQFLVDAVAAYTSFEGILAALFHRERTGQGQKVEVNMLDAITMLQIQEISVHTVGGKAQSRSAEPHAHVFIRAPYGTFETADGYIIVAFPPLDKFGTLIGEPAFAGMDSEVDGWTQRDLIFARTRERLKTRTSQDWLDLFRQNDVWSGPVYGYADLLKDPQVLHNGTFIEYDHPTEGHIKAPGFPIRFSATPSTLRRGAPLAGEHSREILQEFGFDAATVDALLSSGAVVQDQSE